MTLNGVVGFGALVRYLSEKGRVPKNSTYSSADALLESREVTERKVYEVEIELKFAIENERNLILLSDLRKIIRSDKTKSIPKIRVVYVPNTMDDELCVRLNTTINNAIKDGINLEVFEIASNVDWSTTQIQALVENIATEHLGNLPSIPLNIHSSLGVAQLAQFKQLQWPIEDVRFCIQEDSDLDWKQLKIYLQESQFPIKIVNSGNAENIDFKPIINALSTAAGTLSFYGIDTIVTDLFHYLMDGNSSHWSMNPSSSVKTIEIRPIHESYIQFEQSKCVIGTSEPEEFLKQMSNWFSTGESWVLQTEKIRIIDRARLKLDLQSFINSISRQSNSLISFSHEFNGREIEIPMEFRKTMQANLARKMQTWISAGSEVSYGRIKLMLIGKGQAGKTSTVRSLLDQSFREDIESTVVADVGQDVAINVQDINSQWEVMNEKSDWVSKEMGECLNRLKQTVESGEQNVVLAQSTSRTQQHHRFLTNVLEQPTEFEDCKEDVIKNVSEELDQYQDRATKKKDERLNEIENPRLTIWDFGGQEVFYALHHLYLTPNGLYILVFNLKLMLDQMEEEMKLIQFWLQSVAVHATGASVILVGTRCRKVAEEDYDYIDAELYKVIKKIENVNVLEAEELLFFPIDNSHRKTNEALIEPLKRRILGCLQSTNGMKAEHNQKVWEKKVPISWIYFMNHLTKRFKQIITANQLLQLANEMNLDQERVVLPMLAFYENAGAIIPFMTKGSHNENRISDYIVLSPEWLLKILGKFIYDKHLHRRDEKLYQKLETRDQIRKYEATGILSKSLLLNLLETKSSSMEADFVLSLGQQMLLMSEWRKSESDVFYLVPTMNNVLASERDMQEEGALDDCFNIYIHCPRYIPIGVFERIICILLSLNRDFRGVNIAPQIKKNFACFYFGNIEIFIENQREQRDFRVAVSKSEVQDTSTLVNVICLIEKLLERLSSDVLGKEMNAEIQLQSVNVKGMRCSWMDLKEAVDSNESEEKVKVILATEKSKLRRFSMFDPFPEVARISLGAERDLIVAQETPALEWQYSCFLAHCWGRDNQTHEKVVRIAKLLSERDLKPWLDENDLRRFVSNDIVKGLRTSACVVVFITEDYLERVENVDTNASREFYQAVAKGTEYLIPVVLEPSCRDPKFWAGTTVGYHFSDALYIDLSSEEMTEANIEKLCDRVEEMSRVERPRNRFDT